MRYRGSHCALFSAGVMVHPVTQLYQGTLEELARGKQLESL